MSPTSRSASLPILPASACIPDPYVITPERIKQPPTSLGGVLRHLGPGFVLSAAVVGSGELIATTTLGAKAGFTLFWIILLSCLVKVVVQLEWGKHTIHSGETTMTALNALPGPKPGKVSWSIWLWLFIQLFKFLQMGGIVGGVAITLNMMFPVVSISLWAIITTLATSLLVYRGHYRVVEKFSLAMMLLFTVFTLASLFFLQATPLRIGGGELQQGFSFHFPPHLVLTAIAAFGITGVGGDEIMYYNYWCIEKGYAAFTGPKQDTPQWAHRAKGWIRVMYYDALLAMAVYTIVTAAFYLLGAAVLHRQQLVPEDYTVVRTLSEMYTRTLGPWADSVFLIGAFMALYSTHFTAAASFSRMFADAFGQLGLIPFYHLPSRRRMVALLAWVFPAVWCLLFLFIRLPVAMILVGGFMTSVLLLLVVGAALHFRYRRLPKTLKPGPAYDAVFWGSSLAIVAIGVYGMIQLFG